MMQFGVIFHTLGILLMLFSSSMLTPIVLNIVFNESCYMPFIAAFSLTFSTGLFLWLFTLHTHQSFKIREGFLLVALFWVVLCLYGSLPFIFFLVHHPHHITDAIFESVSGLTTTGASIFHQFSKLPHALQFYHQQMQFLGGMGIVVLAVAVLPMLGVGGMQLYRAETPGPMKEQKLTPRIAQTAKALWYIYLGLTILCCLAYKYSGMTWFEAIGESFATVSTGGFSLHTNGFAHYTSPMTRYVASLFMFLSAINFGLHFIAIKKRSLRPFFQDEEWRVYTFFLTLSILLVFITLLYHGTYHSIQLTFSETLFHVISFSTTTGYTAININQWPSYVPFYLMMLALIGGCAASTSGGLKMIRVLLVFKQIRRERLRLIHPNVIYPIKIGRAVVEESVLQSMWAFMSAFVGLFLILVFLLLGCGNDFVTAFSAVNATLTNAGTGLGHVSQLFSQLSIQSKWVLIFSMLIGRLEIFSLIILCSKQFWEN
jgi:trk system potassium uptake protein TrkH